MPVLSACATVPAHRLTIPRVATHLKARIIPLLRSLKGCCKCSVALARRQQVVCSLNRTVPTVADQGRTAVIVTDCVWAATSRASLAVQRRRGDQGAGFACGAGSGGRNSAGSTIVRLSVTPQ